MKLSAKRLPGESQETYRARRIDEQEAVDIVLAGRPSDMQWRRYRFGYDGIKVLSMHRMEKISSRCARSN